MKGKKMSDVVNRIYVAEPRARDHKERPPVIPQVSFVYSVVLKGLGFLLVCRVLCSIPAGDRSH
jgi:hypothetical protein